MGDITKKQHYVPRMYLRNFNNGMEDYVYEYNHHTNEICNRKIDKLCEENYLYEIRDEEGNFLFPQLKNKIEKVLAEIDTQDSTFLKVLLEKVHNGKGELILQEEERQSLLGFILIMLIRNPVVRDSIPEALKLSIGQEINRKAEIAIAWMVTILKISEYGAGLDGSQIVFLKAHNSLAFITSNLPMYFVGMPIQREFYMPLSPQIGIELHIPSNALINLNKCAIRQLSPGDTDNCNCKILQREGSLISSSETVLRRYIDFMNNYDKSAINPYIQANLRMLEMMSKEDFRILVSMFIDNEIYSGNEVYVDTYKAMIQKGYTRERALMQMSEVLEDEVRKAFLTNKTPDDEICGKLLQKHFLTYICKSQGNKSYN